MNPTVILVIQALLQYGPAAAQAIQKILSNPNPTAADWQAVFATASQTNYDAYIAAAQAKAGIPAGTPAPAK